MKNKFYLQEFAYFNGVEDVVFNIVELNDDMKNIVIAITKCGKTTVQTLELKQDRNGVYFEYGVAGQEHIYIDDFEEAGQ